MKHQDSLVTLTTLGNANELVRTIVQNVVGNEVANTLNGAPLARSVIYNLIQARLAAKMAQHTRG